MIVTAPAVSAAKPCSGVMRMIRLPIVLMILLPPAIVPAAIAPAHTMMTHIGTSFDPGGGVIQSGMPV